MSRFFRKAGDSDSDSESSDEELLSSGDELQPARPAPSAAKPAMARFLKTAGSDSSDSDSSDDSDSDSDEEKPRRSGLPLHSDSEDEDSEEEAKGARIMSAQEKRLAEMEATGKAMDNALKISDWVVISNGKPKSHPWHDPKLLSCLKNSTSLRAWFKSSRMSQNQSPHSTSRP